MLPSKCGSPRIVRGPGITRWAMMGLAAFKNVFLTGFVAIFVMAHVRVCVMLFFIRVTEFAVRAFMVKTRAVTITVIR